MMTVFYLAGLAACYLVACHVVNVEHRGRPLACAISLRERSPGTQIAYGLVVVALHRALVRPLFSATWGATVWLTSALARAFPRAFPDDADDGDDGSATVRSRMRVPSPPTLRRPRE